MKNYFQILARYHAWATGKMFAGIAKASEDEYRHDGGLFFKSIHGTLNHQLVAEQIWFARFAEGVSPRLQLNAELEPDRAILENRLRTAVSNWANWLYSVNDDEFEQRCRADLNYTTTKGIAVHLPYAATLGHVFNHGTHHRGQISTALTAVGYEAPVMDLVFMLQDEMKEQ